MQGFESESLVFYFTYWFLNPSHDLFPVSVCVLNVYVNMLSWYLKQIIQKNNGIGRHVEKYLNNSTFNLT